MYLLQTISIMVYLFKLEMGPNLVTVRLAARKVRVWRTKK